MLFNRSTIFRAAWADARAVHANFTRNARIFGPAPSLQSCFSKALREAWATAKAAAHDALVRLDFSDAPLAVIASRRAALNAQLAAFS